MHHYSAGTLLLAATAMLLTYSIALLTATAFMVRHLRLPHLVIPNLTAFCPAP